MIPIQIILGLIFIHWIADFVCQTDEQAKGKSTSWYHLLDHTFYYSLIFGVSTLLYWTFTKSSAIIMLFPLITLICHTATDFYTSRVNSMYHKENKIHEFFVSVGFDQVLHYFQLILTFYFLTK